MPVNKKLSRSKEVDNSALTSLIENKMNDLRDLFKKIKAGDEFEFIFFSKKGKYLPQEKYLELCKYFTSRVSTDKSVILYDPINMLDISYQQDSNNNIRCTLTEEAINLTMKKLNTLKNHVVFKTILDMWINKKTTGTEFMKKEKKIEQTIDVDDIDMRARLSHETNLTKNEIDTLLKIDETSLNKIKFRYKQRITLYVHGNDKTDDFIKIDLTYTKNADSYNKLNHSVPNYELEIEYGTNKSVNEKCFFTSSNILNLFLSS